MTRSNASHEKGSWIPMAGLYDQLTIFGGNSNPNLVDEICTYLSIPVGRAEVFKFSNDNTFVRIGNSVRQDDVFVVQSFSTPVNDSIMELLIMIDALKRSSAGRITAVMRPADARLNASIMISSSMMLLFTGDESG